MKLNEIGYMILETIRDNKIVDDEKIDLRLIYDWVHMKRAEFIKKNRNTNPNYRTNQNLTQAISLSTEVISVTDAGDYPYSDDDTQLYSIVQSVETIPSIIEDKSGPMIVSLESQDLMKFPFSIVPYNQLRFSGNGRFNSNIIFGALRDNRIYFKYNSFFDTYDNIVINAVFEDPTEVGDFDPESTEYPANGELIEYIKNSVFGIDIRQIFAGKSDVVNDASGEIA